MIDNLETNKLVGVLVLGKTFHHKFQMIGGKDNECNYCGMFESEAKSNLICEPYIPDYSTDISACGEVLEWAVRNSKSIGIHSVGNLGYVLSIESENGPVIVKELTLPAVICRGALELRKKI
jgi:hypothetical protein